MGDRGNVLIGYKDRPGVYLYTHWEGTELPKTVQKALAKRWRWDDEAYLTRIIFDEMTDGQHGRENGFGISTDMLDNQIARPIINLDCYNKTVTIGCSIWTFEEYINDNLDDMWF